MISLRRRSMSTRWPKASSPVKSQLQVVENAGLDSVMTNSFGFGGTNGSMILSKYNG